jgi:hypothetical protein
MTAMKMINGSMFVQPVLRLSSHHGRLFARSCFIRVGCSKSHILIAIGWEETLRLPIRPFSIGWLSDRIEVLTD